MKRRDCYVEFSSGGVLLVDIGKDIELRQERSRKCDDINGSLLRIILISKVGLPTVTRLENIIQISRTL